MQDQLLTVKQACAFLQVTKKSLYRWIHSGQVRAYRLKPNSNIRIQVSDVLEPLTGKSASHQAGAALAFGRSKVVTCPRPDGV